MNNQTVIDTVVKYSKDCIIMRFIKSHLKTSLSMVKHMPSPFVVREADTINLLIKRIEMCIDERENDIGKLLMPLFEGKDFGHKNSIKHSLTINEIRDGYITLDGEEYIILTRPFKSEISDLSYNSGILYKIGSGILKNDIKDIKRLPTIDIMQDLMNIIIKKKNAYEYIK